MILDCVTTGIGDPGSFCGCDLNVLALNFLLASGFEAMQRSLKRIRSRVQSGSALRIVPCVAEERCNRSLCFNQ